MSGLSTRHKLSALKQGVCCMQHTRLRCRCTACASLVSSSIACQTNTNLQNQLLQG